MRHRLRTLLIAAALGPIIIAAAWEHVFRAPVEYVQAMLGARRDAIEYWDRKYPGWRQNPAIIDESDPIPPRAKR
jgi:hypothetical protein